MAKFPFVLLLTITCFRPAFGQQDADQKLPAGAVDVNTPRLLPPPTITWVHEPADEQLPLPAGVRHLTWHSKLVDRDIGYCIYLPPGYESSGEKYPVIYNLHGNGGNELTGLLVAEVLHEGIVSGRWPPMILVQPNSGRFTFYKDSHDGKYPMESIFIKEFIPYIDRTFRTIAARHGRCIEGFSMGGRGSIRLAMKYPDLFCSVFCQAGNVPRLSRMYDPARPETYPNSYLGPRREAFVENDTFVLVEKNVEQIRGHLRIQLACGSQDFHYITLRDFRQHLLSLGVDHTYLELEGMKHRRDDMIELLRPIWFDYHAKSLRLAAEAAPKLAK